MTVPHHCLHGCDQAPVSLRTVPAGVTPSVDKPRQAWWRQVIAYLRRWSGDDAYERYLAEHQGHGHEVLNRREFYKRYLDRRAGGSRCC